MMSVYHRYFRSLSLICAALLLQACAGLSVSQDYDTSYDFGAVTSFAWLPPKTPREELSSKPFDELTHRRFVEAIAQNLGQRGLQQVEPENASVLISYHLSSEDKIKVDSFGSWYSHFGYYPCYHCGFYPGFNYHHFHDNDLWVREYTEDEVIIDMVDPVSKRLIWRGSVARNQPTMATPMERDLYVTETVNAILAKFPPGSVSP
ncbi:DUF4136 domain-containing protein [Spongiibacter sp. UBA6593]|uniref:DUF4136 domain-containing protein n=1 Tax=Spongiibacter sp. UBA6593 TaxID=1947544 RepID=UPI00257CEC14|nr:DUF4136 domain-containing protein [Spongiibacter sp. UBA6593]